jgi:apolipoprotein N-acyltransferase
VAEYSPVGLGWIADLLALPYDDRVTDESPVPSFAVAGTHVANTICLDLAYSGELAATAPVTGVIVNQSNFVAFAGERVRRQFLTIARARALEQAKPVLVASNSGPTAAIDSRGRVIARLPSHGAANLDVNVQPGAGSTAYATFGEILWLLALASGAGITALLRGGKT